MRQLWQWKQIDNFDNVNHIYDNEDITLKYHKDNDNDYIIDYKTVTDCRMTRWPDILLERKTTAQWWWWRDIVTFVIFTGVGQTKGFIVIIIGWNKDNYLTLLFLPILSLAGSSLWIVAILFQSPDWRVEGPLAIPKTEDILNRDTVPE